MSAKDILYILFIQTFVYASITFCCFAQDVITFFLLLMVVTGNEQ